MSLAYKLLGAYQKFGVDPTRLPKWLKQEIAGVEFYLARNGDSKPRSSYRNVLKGIAVVPLAALAYDALTPAYVRAEENALQQQPQLKPDLELRLAKKQDTLKTNVAEEGLPKTQRQLDEESEWFLRKFVYYLPFAIEGTDRIKVTFGKEGIDYRLVDRFGEDKIGHVFDHEVRGFVPYSHIPLMTSRGKFFSLDYRYQVARDILRVRELYHRAEDSLRKASELMQKGDLEPSLKILELVNEHYKISKMGAYALPKYVILKIDEQFLGLAELRYMESLKKYARLAQTVDVQSHLTYSHTSPNLEEVIEGHLIDPKQGKNYFFRAKGNNITYYLLNETGEVVKEFSMKRDATAKSLEEAMIFAQAYNAENSALSKPEREKLYAEEFRGRESAELLKGFIADIARNFKISIAGNYEGKKGFFNTNIETIASAYDTEKNVLNLQLSGSLGLLSEHTNLELALGPVFKNLTEDGTVWYLAGLLQWLKKWGYERGSLEFEQIGLVFGVDRAKDSFYLNIGLPLSKKQIESRKLIDTKTSTEKQDLGDVVREITKTTETFKEKIQEAVPFIVVEYSRWLKEWFPGEIGVQAGIVGEWLGGAESVKDRYFIGPRLLFRLSETVDLTLEAMINLGNVKDYTVLTKLDYYPGRNLINATIVTHSLKSVVKFKPIQTVGYEKQKEREEETSQDFKKVGGALSTNPTSGVAPLTVEYKVTDITGKATFELTYKPGGGLADKTVKTSQTSDTQKFTYEKAGIVKLELIIKDALEQTKTLTGLNVTINDPLSNSCSGSPNPAEVNQQVTWSGSPSGGKSPYTHSWTGTDGLSGTTQSITITYTTAGIKQATYAATSSDSQSKSANCQITVSTQPALSINDVTATEGDSGTKNFTFTVTLSRASSLNVTVDFATSNGTATAGVDYVAKSGTLTIPAGSTSGTITTVVSGDTDVEGDETFFVDLSNAKNATISDNQGKGTIQNDDAAPPPEEEPGE